MRILQVSPYFFPYIGGQERYVQSLSQALVDLGHSVEIFTSDYPKSTEHEKLRKIRIRRFHCLARPLNNPITPTMLFHLRNRFDDFDLVHTHNEHGFPSLCCSMVRPLTKVPLLVTCHGRLRYDQQTKDLVERVFSQTFCARVFKTADRVLAMSDQDAEYIHSLGASKENIRVIPNGVNLGHYSQIEELPRQFSFQDKKLVLFVGPLIKRKGPHVLVQAIPQIVKEYPETVFLFIGKGNYKSEVEELSKKLGVEEYTCFAGYVPESRLHAFYSRSDIFVLPSISEALPYTVLDALAFSKPVVTTLLPGMKENFTEGAILIPPKDVNALARSLITLLGDERYCKELGAKGRKLVETRFDFDVVVRKILNVYEELLRK